MTSPPRRRGPMQPEGARVRRGTVRIPGDVAARVRAGHPYLFREALGARPLREPAGVIALRVVTRDPSELVDAAAIARRVEAAKRLRDQLLPATAMTAYRLFH